VLVALQFPFVDARPFLPTPSYRLGRPVWPIPEPGKEFVRKFGPVNRTEGGGIENWPGEGSYCRATHAVRFDGSIEEFFKSHRWVGVDFGCTFRRFMYDGLAIARIEIGFGQRELTGTSSPQRADRWLILLRDVVDMSVRIPSATSRGENCKLLDAPERLAAAYLESTTQIFTRQRKATEPWWFSPGLPLLLVAYRDTPTDQLPPTARPVDLGFVADVRLHYLRPSFSGREVGVWILGAGPAADPDVVRRLRLHIFRLHAERDCLKQIFRLITVGKLKIDEKSEGTARLQQYFVEAVAVLNKQRRFGLPQSEMLRAAQQFEDVIEPGERETLLTYLERIRGNVLRTVAKYTDEQANRVGPGITLNVDGGIATINLDQYTGGKSVTNQTVTFGDNATIHGDFVVAKTIKNAFNTAQEAQTPELKSALEELTKRVAEMSKQLPTEQARQVASDLETFAKEAVSNKPRQKWWELSADGLKDAAKAVAGIGPSVIEAVGQVVKLLAV
jgi:hypothetical protein